ncbi:Multiple resistance and pH homeostasis protein D [Jannaschia seosinensis]|uniref:Multiple resistance and pH homeostasis protein D n=1 Tax=Jannaschia seosinensis TaxID=313367 RepID=A0A0M7BBI8_9RHOB|nr:proton-conducting transporter membrane subunit [Jannaschia seosinensis]CUH40147.1 Multiple resistance and pH homeostasis protein D [Jannaschia seosinensis]
MLMLGAAILLLAEVIAHKPQAAQMSEWPAPFGITPVADRLSAIMIVITAITALAVSIHATAEISTEMEELGYRALFQVLVAGVTETFLTGDLFNPYFSLDVMLISSFSLIILGGRRIQMDAGIEYVTLNLISTVLFLSGTGLLYGIKGTLNLANLHFAAQDAHPGLVTVIATMLLVDFKMKTACWLSLRTDPALSPRSDPPGRYVGTVPSGLEIRLRRGA